MSYYRGDYRPGYYRGDPGFFSFLGGLAKSAVGLIPGVGPLASKALGMIHATPKPMASAAAAGMSIVRHTGATVGAAIMKHPVLSAAGAAAATGAAAGAAMMHPAAAAALAPAGLMKGFHISKKTGAVVRNRRMNVCNARALRRALRRAHGFTKLAMHTIHLVHPKKKGRFGGFKKRRRK